MDPTSSLPKISSSFRIIFTISDFSQEIPLKNGNIKIALSSLTKTVSIPCNEAVSLDFTDVQIGSKIECTIEDPEGKPFGSSEVDLPDSIFENHETEITQSIQFHLVNTENVSSMTAKLCLIFLNKGLFKEKAKQKNSKPKTLTRQKNQSPERKGLNRSVSPLSKKAYSSASKIDDAYLTAVIDQHSISVKQLVGEHNAMHELVHQSKLASVLPANFAQDSLHIYTPTKNKGIKEEKVTKSSVNKTIFRTFVANSGDNSERRVNTEERKRAAPLPTQEEDQSINQSQDLAERLKAMNQIGGNPVHDAEEQDLNSLTNGLGYLNKLLQEKMNSKKGIKSIPSSANASFFKNNSMADYCSVTEKVNTEKEAPLPGPVVPKSEFDHLQGIVNSQKTQIEMLQLKQKEIDQLRQDLQESELARKNLQESMLEKTGCLEIENSNLRRQMCQFMNEKDQLLQENKDLRICLDSLQGGPGKEKTEPSEKRNWPININLMMAELNNLNEELKITRAALEKSESDRMELQKKYRTSLEVFERSLEGTEKAVEKLTQEKRYLILELAQCKQELSQEKTDHDETRNKLLMAKTQIEMVDNYKELARSLESQRDDLNTRLVECRKCNAEMRQLSGELKEEIMNKVKLFEEEKRMVRANESSEGKSKNQETVVNQGNQEQLIKELNEARLKISELNSRIVSLGQVASVSADIKQQLDSTSKRLSQALEDKDLLEKQLDELLSTQQSINVRIFELERPVSQFKNTMVEKELSSSNVRNGLVTTSKTIDLYLPQKNDAIDNALADFLNITEDFHKYRSLFVWEEPGTYQFGTKRISIRNDGRKVSVRVGGGFVKLEDFLEKFGPLELEKIYRVESSPAKVNNFLDKRKSFSK